MALNDQFLKLFNGKETISGHAEGYNNALEWLKEGKEQQKKMFTCVVLFEKPIQFLATGKTKDGSKGDGKGINKQLLDVLPKLTEEQLKGLPAARDAKKYGAFIDVNFSTVKRVAMLAIEKGWLKEKIVDDWIKGYGGIPSQYNQLAPKWVKMDKDTRTIKLQTLEEFKSEKSVWEEFTL